ncbi:unnamed protein product [Sphagnum balticum]
MFRQSGRRVTQDFCRIRWLSDSSPVMVRVKSECWGQKRHGSLWSKYCRQEKKTTGKEDVEGECERRHHCDDEWRIIDIREEASFSSVCQMRQQAESSFIVSACPICLHRSKAAPSYHFVARKSADQDMAAEALSRSMPSFPVNLLKYAFFSPLSIAVALAMIYGEGHQGTRPVSRFVGRVLSKSLLPGRAFAQRQRWHLSKQWHSDATTNVKIGDLILALPH